MSISKSQTEKVGSIFNGNRFIIPTYQRKYSWTDNERKDLWQDIEESIEDNMNHFVGTLSFKENKSVGLSTDTVYEIIDGQQRITTLFILLKVLIDKIQDEDIKKSQLSAFIGSEGNLKLHPQKIFDSYDDLLVFKESLGILGRLEENTIFTHHYYSSRRLFASTWNNRDGADTIFDNLKLRCEELKNRPSDLKIFISEYLSDFENFAVSYSNLVKDIETKSIYQKPFRYLEFTATLYPLLVRLYMQNKLDELLPVLESIEVRVYKLRGTNPIADIYSLSSLITERDLSAGEIKNNLINFSEKFVNNHVFGTYLDGEIYGNGAVKYILSEFSNDNPDIATYKDLQVEHVFSKEPNYIPSSYGFADDYDYEKNRLGNLSLLEKTLNPGLGNLPPINKVDGYLASIITDIRNLAGEIQKGNFKKTNVDDRRKLIIDFCITRFNL